MRMCSCSEKQIQLLRYCVCLFYSIIKTFPKKSFRNNEIDCDKSGNNLNETPISTKYSSEDEMVIGSMSESCIGSDDYTSISLRDVAPT